MKLWHAALTLLIPVTLYLIGKRLTRSIEHDPQPQIPKYRYTTDRHYDYDKAVQASRRARTRSRTGRTFPPREELIH